MNYNDFFKSALSAAYQKNPMTDDDAFISIIKERAKEMKKEDNIRKITVTEFFVDCTEPKKNTKIVRTVTCVAGVAVLTAVFGLNYLNEHGWLKESGSDEFRTGYHVDVFDSTDTTETANAEDIYIPFNENTAEIDCISGIEWDKYAVSIPDETRYEFDGFTVEPRWCYFYGTTVYLAYDIFGETPDTAEINVVSGEAEVTGYELNRSDNRIVLMSDITYSEARSKVEIDFVDQITETKYTLTIESPEAAG